ncbi:copper amine oxidase [Acetivibrio thermocellus]|uniref:copper amine oxidase n=1 Tax=Acetivibrio thermocellus TaxID=1515 RepID=UPI0034D95F38
MKFIADPSGVDVLEEVEVFALGPTEVIVVGRLEFIYHEASDEYLEKFEGKLKKGVWYGTNIAVIFTLYRPAGSMEVDKIILDNIMLPIVKTVF